MAEMHGFARWMVNRRTAARAQKELRRLGAHLEVRPGARILELGSGGGGLLALLQERLHPGRLVGTDVDPAQVEETRAFLTRRWGSLPATLELHRADALSIPFPDASFDVVFAMLVLHHVEAHHGAFERRPDALREIRRVLSPGGRLVYSEFSRRAETRASLIELGFVPTFERSSWRVDHAIFATPPAATRPSGLAGGERAI